MSCRFVQLFCGWMVFLGLGCQSVITVDDGVDTVNDDDTDDGHCGDSSLVCNPFDKDTAYSLIVRNGDVGIDTAVAYAGGGSLKSETTQIESFAYISSAFPSIESGTVYFRLYLWIPEGTVTGTIKVVNLSGGGEPVDDSERGIDINVGANLSIEVYQHGNRARYSSTADAIAEGEWNCLRGSYTISPTAGETSVWVNDNLAVSTTASTDSIINGGVSVFNTGIGWTEGGQDTAVVYFDQVLVDTGPVSCSD